MYTTYAKRHVQGFSLIEILVVVAIIGVLSSLAIASMSNARENSRIKTEIAAVEQFKLNLALYREMHNTFPPGVSGALVDNCSFCALRPGTYNFSNAVLQWTQVANAFSPVFYATPPLRDSWGNPYAYDNNYKVNGQPLYTTLCSMGPDGVLSTVLQSSVTVSNPVASGDDICIFLQ